MTSVDDFSAGTGGTSGGHRFVGRPVVRVDAPAKVTGTATYGVDVEAPGMLVGKVLRVGVVDDLLEERSAEPLGEPSVELTLDDGGVHLAATVVDQQEPVDRELTRVLVKSHHGGGSAVAERIGRGIEVSGRLEARLLADREVMPRDRFRGDRREVDGELR